MEQTRLGLSMRIVEAAGYQEQQDAISHDWFDLLQKWKCTPLLIPNKVKDLVSYLSGLALEGIILTGGNNLTPKLAGHPEWKVSDTAHVRDDIEYRILDYAGEKKIPVLGICRGFQIINSYFGGTLTLAAKNVHVTKTHKVTIQSHSWKQILGSELMVNSYHNHAISADSLAERLVPFAVDQDGLIEGAAHQSLPILGLMWHPERKQPEPIPNEMLLSRLLTEGVFWR